MRSIQLLTLSVIFALTGCLSLAPDYQRPAAPVRPKRKPLEGADLRYVLWSGSIVSGVLLTLVAFVYACTL